MTDLITYETIRAVHRAEKEEILQKLPDGFFQSVSNWLEHKRGMRDNVSLLEAESAKKILDDLINRRQRKIILAALRTIRGEVPPDNLTDKEQKFFDKIVILFKELKQDLQEQIIGYDEIVEEKIKEAKESLNDLRKLKEIDTERRCKASSFSLNAKTGVLETKPEIKEDLKEIEEPEPEVKEEKKAEPEKVPFEADGIKVKILADLPRFVGNDLVPYGPFTTKQETYLPEDIVDLLVMRKFAEKV